MTMPLLLAGINHKTAAIDFRESAAFITAELQDVLADLNSTTGSSEAVIVSTCNRTELITTGIESARLLKWWSDNRKLPDKMLRDHSYLLHGNDMIEHLVKVCCGMDSMIFGEPEIFGQVKQAYKTAREYGCTGPILSQIFEQSFHITKRIRTETEIGRNPTTLASVIMHLIQRLFARPAGTSSLIIGAGDVAELVARRFAAESLTDTTVCSRTEASAQALAHKFGFKSLPLSKLDRVLGNADIVIACSSSQQPLIQAQQLQINLTQSQRNWPLLMLDLAVPRNLDSEINRLPGVYLYDIDDLQKLISSHTQRRNDAIPRAEQLIEAGVRNIELTSNLRSATELINQFRKRAEIQRDAVLAEMLNKLRTEDSSPEQLLELLAHRLTNKLLHEPSTGLRKMCSAEDSSELLRIAADLLNIKHNTDAGDNS